MARSNTRSAEAISSTRPLRFQTSLRSLDDTTAAVVNKTTAGIVNFYPLVDGRYEFKAQAVDKKGLKDPNAPRDTFVISGASRHVFADTTWNMVSVPCTSMPISTVAGTGSMLHWDESGVEQDIYSFYLKPPDITQTFPGMSYWRKSPDTVTIALKPQDVHDTTISIQLLKGTMGGTRSPRRTRIPLNGLLRARRGNGTTRPETMMKQTGN